MQILSSVEEIRNKYVRMYVICLIQLEVYLTQATFLSKYKKDYTLSFAQTGIQFRF